VLPLFRSRTLRVKKTRQDGKQFLSGTVPRRGKRRGVWFRRIRRWEKPTSLLRWQAKPLRSAEEHRIETGRESFNPISEAQGHVRGGRRKYRYRSSNDGTTRLCADEDRDASVILTKKAQNARSPPSLNKTRENVTHLSKKKEEGIYAGQG